MGKIRDRNISLMELNNNDIDFIRDIKDKNYDPILRVGDIVVEEKPSIEDETFNKRFYKIIGIVENLNEIVINSFLVKEVYKNNHGEWVETDETTSNNTIFSLSRSDCKFLNIPYEDGIEVYPFPKNYDYFHKIEENSNRANFTYENYSRNLAFYPTSNKDDSIRRIVIKISGFKQRENYIGFNDHYFKTEKLPQMLYIESKIDLISQDMSSGIIAKYHNIPYKVVSRAEKDNIIDDEGNIYIELNFSFRSKITTDGLNGISSDLLDGKTINDIINVKLLDIDTTPNINEFNNVMEELAKRLNHVDREYYRITHDFEWMRQR